MTARLSSLKTLFLAALVLRVALALVTEVRPIFPAYYYNDAVLADASARDILADVRGGRPLPAHSLGQNAYACWVAGLYALFGPHPLAAKLANCLLAATAIVLFTGLCAGSFSPGAALLAGWAFALWPSCVFFTSQNFKDSLVLLCAWTVLWAAAGARRAARAAAGLPAAAALAALRSFDLAMTLAAALLAAAARLGGRRGWALGAAAVAAALVLHAPLGDAARRALVNRGDPRYAGIDPLTPQGFAQARQLRQDADAIYGRSLGHPSATQLFYGQRFDSPLDVARFAPKAAFYVLFMPLPGLYPLRGKPGRELAAAENVGLLLLALLGAAAALRRRWGPVEIGLLAFFAFMLAGSAFLEFDLGAAARHKITYLPALFPFAFSWLDGRRKARGPRPPAAP